jgi:predicted amidohydrolase
MQSIRVAAVSMNGRLGEPERVLDDIASWCERAVTERADLVLFPELVVHGHCTPNTWALAVAGGQSVQRLTQFARQHRLVLYVGLSEKERDIVYNTQVVVGPDGYIGKQRKLHLSRDEVLYYKAAVASRTDSRQDGRGHARGRLAGGTARTPELSAENTPA